MKEMLRNCHGHNLSKGNIIKIFYNGLNEITQEVLNAAACSIFLYKTPNQAYPLLEDKVILKLDWAKNQKTKSYLKKTIAFAAEANCNSDTDKIMTRMDAMTMKMDAQYKDFQYSLKQSNLDDDDIPMSREEEAKFMQTFRRTRFYNDYRDRDSNRDNTILKEKLFAEFDEFMGMTADENSESEYNTKEPPFKKITFNIDYKIKTSLKEPPMDLELKPLPDNPEYIPIDPMDQEKTKFTCPLGTYAYRRMPFGLCNAPATFQRCMLAIFHDMIEESVKVFMEDFFFFGSSFDHCLNNLDKVLQHYEDAHLVLNWEKYHFMIKEGIMLRHKVSEVGLEVDKAKIDIISKPPPPINIKRIRSFLGYAGFYRIFIKDFSKLLVLLPRKGTENVAADHLFIIEKEETRDDSEVDDNFSGETLMKINTEDDPWFADFATT
nr:reverse transcriptase domain-containing protein [Tanacetum cinerariifolium]